MLYLKLYLAFFLLYLIDFNIFLIMITYIKLCGIIVLLSLYCLRRENKFLNLFTYLSLCNVCGNNIERHVYL